MFPWPGKRLSQGKVIGKKHKKGSKRKKLMTAGKRKHDWGDCNKSKLCKSVTKEWSTSVLTFVVLLHEQQWPGRVQTSLPSLPLPTPEAVVVVMGGALLPGTDVSTTTSGRTATETVEELYCELSSVMVDSAWSTGGIRWRTLRLELRDRERVSPRGLAGGFGDGGCSCSALFAGMTCKQKNRQH